MPVRILKAELPSLGRDCEPKPAKPREMQEIVIASDEPNLVVDAYLRDQAISKSCSTSLGDELCAQSPRSVPISRMRFEQRKFAKHTG